MSSPSSFPAQVCRTVCALHVHSHYSDGTAGMEEILAAARSAGIQALLITDHHTMAAARHGWHGWHDDVLVIVGYEHSDPHDENHLLIFGLDEPLDPALPAVRYVNEARELGATVFLAHPVERRGGRGRLKAYPWTAGFELPFHGIEVWNFMSLWAERFSPRRAILHYLFPGLAGERPDTETLAVWDGVARSRPVAGIAGLDAHALKVPWGPFKLTLFSHARHLGGPLTVVETPRPPSRVDAREDVSTLLDHLARGNSTMGLMRLGPVHEITAEIGGEERTVWGETHHMGQELVMTVRTPRSTRMRLLRSGAVVASARGTAGVFHIGQPGVYRVELRREGRLWVLTNHFKVVGSLR